MGALICAGTYIRLGEWTSPESCRRWHSCTRDNWHGSRFSLHPRRARRLASSHASSAILHRVDTMTSRNLAGALAVGATLWLSGCGDSATAPVDQSPAMTSADETAAATAAGDGAGGHGPPAGGRPGHHRAAPSRAAVRPALSLLGQALAFDKELSGNRDISCMTCHLSRTATVDGRSVAIGQGGTGVGTARVHPQGRFVHRSAPALFNLHALSTLTWDGRVFVDKNGVVRTPGGEPARPPARGPRVRHGRRRCRCSRCSRAPRCAPRRGTSSPPSPMTSTSGSGGSSCGVWARSRSTAPCS